MFFGFLAARFLGAAASDAISASGYERFGNTSFRRGGQDIPPSRFNGYGFFGLTDFLGFASVSVDFLGAFLGVVMGGILSFCLLGDGRRSRSGLFRCFGFVAARRLGGL